MSHTMRSIPERPTGPSILLAAVILLLAGCEKKEPTYEGRPLSDWVKDLGSPTYMVRVRAAHAVGQIGPEARRAAPILIRLLEDKEHLVRWAAAGALGRFGAHSRDALPGLDKLATGDPEASVRDAARHSARAIREAVEREPPG